MLAGRLQVQERLTAQIADAVDRGLRPRGVAVLVEAEHLCMALRGAQKEGAQVVTSAFRGVFAQCAEQRREFLALARTVAR
jgi:GTP cyclohydrolase I